MTHKDAEAMREYPSELTRLIRAHAAGEAGAADELLPMVQKELRGLAVRALKKERNDHTLEPTELVHEAYLKLAGDGERDWAGRTHFFAVAASAVRQVLVDHARAHRARKRNDGLRSVTLHDFDAALPAPSIDILALDEALEALHRINERQGQVVELRFFAGLNTEEIAGVLGVSPRTVKGLWRAARAWLIVRMGGPRAQS